MRRRWPHGSSLGRTRERPPSLQMASGLPLAVCLRQRFPQFYPGLQGSGVSPHPDSLCPC